MSKLYLGSIDLKKIDKSKIVTKDKNGVTFKNGAAYFPIAVYVNDEPDNYGNTMAIQAQRTKEERDNKVDAVYLGNLKEFERQEVPSILNNDPVKRDFDEDDLPF